MRQFLSIGTNTIRAGCSIIVLLFLLLVVIGVFTADGPSLSTAPPASVIPAAEPPDELLIQDHTAAAPAATVPASVAPSATPTWVELGRWQGTGDRKTQPFRLTGTQAAVEFDVKSQSPQYSALNVRIVRPGEGYGESAVSHDGTGRSVSYVYVGPGTYYLDISSANCSWAVRIMDAR